MKLIIKMIILLLNIIWKFWNNLKIWIINNFSNFIKNYISFSFIINIYSKNFENIKFLFEKLLVNQSNNKKFYINFIIKLNIINNKKFIINCINNINERKYIIILLNISNLTKNVNINLEFIKKKFYIWYEI